MEKITKILLTEKEMPRQWYNIMADMPNKPLPLLNPATGKPVGPEDLSVIFPMELIKQEVSTERYIAIPDEVVDLYYTYPPVATVPWPEALRRPWGQSRIYYKYEGGNYSGSHKANTAIPQAYYNKQEGVRRITTETGRPVGQRHELCLQPLRARTACLSWSGSAITRNRDAN